MKSVRMICKVSGWAEKYQDDLQSVWMICKVSLWSGKRVFGWSRKYSGALQKSFTLHRHILTIINSDYFLIGLNWYIGTAVLLQIRQCTHLRALSGKFLRGKSCYPESFWFFLTLLLRFSPLLPNRVSVKQDDRCQKIWVCGKPQT